jgi:adenosylcobinamide kinase/adenosylcobinamide-phosphate guanylyltransferase
MFKKDFHKGCMLVVGGAKSGKSRFALDICNGLTGSRIFLATAQAKDSEMDERIKRHQMERGDEWMTEEESLKVVESIRKLAKPNTVILLDCLTLWVNNLYMAHGDNRGAIEHEMESLIGELSKTKGIVVAVSNEVGSGIVPENMLARIYRDDVGMLNQRIAQISKKVVTLIAGLPVVLKDE